MTRFGPHIDPPLAAIPGRLAAHGWTTFQTTLRNPIRLAKEGIPEPEDQEAYRAETARHTAPWGIVHASLITSLGSPDPRIRNGSASALVSDANLAASLGLVGVCFHVGYQKGHATREAALDAVAYKLTDVLSRLKPGAKVLLENGAEGTELGQTIAEIGYVVRAVPADPARLGVILDTCHLHVSGFDLADPAAPDRLAEEIEAAGLTPYMTGLHINDAREACGSKRDRHAVPGDGTIGEGLVRLVAHPTFASLHGILEIATSEVARGIAFLEGKN